MEAYSSLPEGQKINARLLVSWAAYKYPNQANTEERAIWISD